ncbi:MAG: hypothetical protein IJZ68_06410 [Bacteroidaceae bacterium]|nr:hypothetical protein [Bacteroidaceae bacterium]
MDKFFLGMKLSSLDMLRVNDITDIYYGMRVGLSNTAAGALEFTTKEQEDAMPYTAKRVPVPGMTILQHCAAKFDNFSHLDAFPNPYLETTLDRVDNTQVLECSITIAADAVHDSLSKTTEGESMEDLFRIMRAITLERGEFVAEMETLSAQHPNVPGVNTLFKAMAIVNPENDACYPAMKPVVDAYAQNYDKQMHSVSVHTDLTTLIDLTIIDTANEMVKIGYHADIFQDVAAVARESLASHCAGELIFFEPNDYLTRILPQVPEKYQDGFLNAFNETLDQLAEERPDYTSTQLATRAMDAAARIIVDRIIDAKMEGIFGLDPIKKITREQFNELSDDEKKMTTVCAETHKNLELVDTLEQHLEELEKDEDELDVDD